MLMVVQSEDLWCQGYNMRTGTIGIFPAFYVVKVAKETNQGASPGVDRRYCVRVVDSLSSTLTLNVPVPKDGWSEQFLVRFLGSVLVPIHKGNDVLCAAMQKVPFFSR